MCMAQVIRLLHDVKVKNFNYQVKCEPSCKNTAYAHSHRHMKNQRVIIK